MLARAACTDKCKASLTLLLATLTHGLFFWCRYDGKQVCERLKAAFDDSQLKSLILDSYWWSRDAWQACPACHCRPADVASSWDTRTEWAAPTHPGIGTMAGSGAAVQPSSAHRGQVISSTATTAQRKAVEADIEAHSAVPHPSPARAVAAADASVARRTEPRDFWPEAGACRRGSSS